MMRKLVYAKEHIPILLAIKGKVLPITGHEDPEGE
jgi:hypothetical protein